MFIISVFLAIIFFLTFSFVFCLLYASSKRKTHEEQVLEDEEQMKAIKEWCEK